LLASLLLYFHFKVPFLPNITNLPCPELAKMEFKSIALQIVKLVYFLSLVTGLSTMATFTSDKAATNFESPGLPHI
jgi:hypothetical protein